MYVSLAFAPVRDTGTSGQKPFYHGYVFRSTARELENCRTANPRISSFRANPTIDSLKNGNRHDRLIAVYYHILA
jgi:hypothetical protein